MASVDNIKNKLIEKILAIRNKEFLIALDNLITSSSTFSENQTFTEEQKRMLKMSDDDIENGHLISQEEMDKRNLKWLNEL